MNLKPLLNYWDKYSQREQYIIIAAGIFLSIIFIYNFIYAPIKTNYSSKSAQIIEKQDSLIFMQQVMPFFKQDTAKFIHPTELMALIQQELTGNEFHAFKSTINQVNLSDVEINFSQVPFNLFLKWLWDLNQRYQFQIKNLDASNLETAGICQLRVVIGV